MRALGTITQGLDASKSGTPAIGNVYWATDTKILYVCYATNVWVAVDDIYAPSTPAQGDIIYYDGAKYNRLPAGTANQLLASGGAGANPSWVNGSLRFLLQGTGSGTYSTGSTVLVPVDATNLQKTLTGLPNNGLLNISWSFIVQGTGGGHGQYQLIDSVTGTLIASATDTTSPVLIKWSAEYSYSGTTATILLQYLTNNPGADTVEVINTSTAGIGNIPTILILG